MRLDKDTYKSMMLFMLPFYLGRVSGKSDSILLTLGLVIIGVTLNYFIEELGDGL